MKTFHRLLMAGTVLSGVVSIQAAEAGIASGAPAQDKAALASVMQLAQGASEKTPEESKKPAPPKQQPAPAQRPATPPAAAPQPARPTAPPAVQAPPRTPAPAGCCRVDSVHLPTGPPGAVALS